MVIWREGWFDVFSVGSISHKSEFTSRLDVSLQFFVYFFHVREIATSASRGVSLHSQEFFCVDGDDFRHFGSGDGIGDSGFFEGVHGGEALFIGSFVGGFVFTFFSIFCVCCAVLSLIIFSLVIFIRGGATGAVVVAWAEVAVWTVISSQIPSSSTSSSSSCSRWSDSGDCSGRTSGIACSVGVFEGEGAVVGEGVGW